MSENIENSYYELVTRKILGTSSLFKIKPLTQDRIFFSVPSNRKIVSTDFNLENVQQLIQLSQKPLAIDIFEIRSQKLIATGCDNGSIYIFPVNQPNQVWELSAKSQQEVFINDIVNYDSRVLVNCYNNGNIRVWDIQSGEIVHTFQKVHEEYTYKLRKTSNNGLISCGSDGYVICTDLEAQKTSNRFYHRSPIWCAEQISNNTIATIGLEPRISIWDIRVNRTVQVCNLKGFQSSFITPKLDHLLYFGRNNFLMKWDRRMQESQLLSKQYMFQSIEGIYLHENKLIACGRGSDISLFKNNETLITLDTDEQMERSSKLSLPNTPQTDSSQIWNMDVELDSQEEQILDMDIEQQKNLVNNNEGYADIQSSQINEQSESKSVKMEQKNKYRNIQEYIKSKNIEKQQQKPNFQNQNISKIIKQEQIENKQQNQDM